MTGDGRYRSSRSELYAEDRGKSALHRSGRAWLFRIVHGNFREDAFSEIGRIARKRLVRNPYPREITRRS